MRPVWIKQKYKLLHLLGREIWGNLIRKYSLPYLKYYVSANLRRICNYVVLEHERRNLFDFRTKFRIFRTRRYTDPDYFEKERIRMRRWWRLRLKKRTFLVNRFFYKKKHIFFPVYRTINNNIKRRLSRFSNFWIGYLALMQLFLRLRRRDLNRRLRLLDKYGDNLKPARLPKFVRKMITFANRYNRRRANFRKWYGRLKPSALPKFLRKVKKHPVYVSKKPLPVDNIFRCPHYKRNRGISSNFTQLGRVIDRRVKLRRKLRQKFMRSLRNPRTVPSVRKRDAFDPDIEMNLDVRPLYPWLLSFFYTFPTQLTRDITSKPYVLSSKLFIFGQSHFGQNVHFPAVFRPVTRFSKRDVLEKTVNQFYLARQALTLLELMKADAPSFLSSGNFEVKLSESKLIYFKWPSFLFKKVLAAPISSFITRVMRMRLHFALRARRRRIRFGWLIYKLKDRRDILLQLKYTVVRLRLGDYEEGFRIPYAPSNTRIRSKKQYRRLELARWQIFYGIFNVNSFKRSFYEAVFKYRTRSKEVFVLYLECRPIFLLHLTNLFPSLYFVEQFIQHKNLILDDQICVDTNYPLDVRKILELSSDAYWSLLNVLLFRLLHFKVLLNVPNFVEMNYALLALSVVSLPKSKQLTMPFLSKLTSFDKHSLIRSL